MVHGINKGLHYSLFLDAVHVEAIDVIPDYRVELQWEVEKNL